MSRPERSVFVCSQQRPPGHPRGCCAAQGSQAVLQTFWQELQARNAYDQVGITYSGCLGPCDGGVNVLVFPDSVFKAVVDCGGMAAATPSHAHKTRASSPFR